MTDDLKGVNFNKIEQELRGRSSCGQWEQTWGWLRSNIVIGFLKGIKRTAVAQCEEAL